LDKVLLTGNESVARGVWEAGGRVVVAYPGTPSTEITENAAKYREINAQWAPNEKVALEVAVGASIGGARSLAAMKHVGLNVAADPLFTAAYTGVRGGLVIVTADDPGMHSSQNEQDNRHYARAAHLPMLEPSSSQEAKVFTALAFAVSEAFDTPVLLRLTTRIAHSQSLVELQARRQPPVLPYEKDTEKYVMVPANAIRRRWAIKERWERICEYADEVAVNYIEWGKDRKLGVIASGAVYQYVKEALPDASVLKLGLTWPLPKKMIEEFAAGVERVVVIEELSSFIEDTVKSWGFSVSGRDIFSDIGEIFSEDIAAALAGRPKVGAASAADAPKRPPVLCPGCPHRGTFYVLNQLKLVVSGDIGCYTLGCLPPLAAMDTTVCMGCSVSGAHGLELAGGRKLAERTVAVLGDSTFIHSGITGLINTVYNGGTTTTLILDNSITAMTGHQHNPATGFNAKGEPAPRLNLEELVRACGVKRVAVVDPFNLKEMRRILKEETAAPEPSVVIVRRPCALIDKSAAKAPLAIDRDKCRDCGLCMGLGCPAIGKDEGYTVIDKSQCVGCGLCASLCAHRAIVSGGAAEGSGEKA